MVGSCPVCGLGEIVAFVAIEQVPVHCNLLWTDREEAVRAPQGDIRLGFCGRCGHIFNVAFDPKLMEYGQTYENSLHFSPRFQAYAESLARRLIERYGLYGKDVIEIGSGTGEFLRLLCELGDNRGVGFDPSYRPEPKDPGDAGQIRFVQDFYSEQYNSFQADLICCRHVLEHIHQPVEFLETVRRAIGPWNDTVVYVEVPNLFFMFQDLSVWDIIYEHCSYFGPSSLGRAFRCAGFDIVDLGEAFEGQFLYAEARPREGGADLSVPTDDLRQIAQDVIAFSEAYRTKVALWQDNLERLTKQGRRAVVWGAGSKGVTFLNTLKPQSPIDYVVDVNPHKHGKYIAGTAQEIVPPEFLGEYRPEAVIVMNPIYRAEIQQRIDGLGLSIELMVV